MFKKYTQFLVPRIISLLLRTDIDGSIRTAPPGQAGWRGGGARHSAPRIPTAHQMVAALGGPRSAETQSVPETARLRPLPPPLSYYYIHPYTKLSRQCFLLKDF